MVETRSLTKAKTAGAVQEQSPNVGNGNLPVATPAAVAETAGQPSGTASYVSGSSVTVRSRILSIEADYAHKMAMMERASMERERAVMEYERTALQLRKQAEIAVLEERGSARSRSRQSNRLSQREVQKWLDDYVDLAIPTTVDEMRESQNVNMDISNSRSIPLNKNRSVATSLPQEAFQNNCLDSVENALDKETFYGVQFTSNTNLTRHYSSRMHLSNINNIAHTPINNVVAHPGPSTNYEPSSEIAKLAQAITALSNGNQSRPRSGDGRLPTFDGKAMDWLTFKRMYEDSKVVYSASENLSRIGMALKGDAREAVAMLLVSAQDPTEVMEALAVRFGRPEIIVLQEVATMRALPKINADGSDLHKFACRVRNSAEVMRLLDQKPYLESPEIFQSVLSKLTPLLRSRWADYASVHFLQQRDCTKLELLARFLVREVDLQLKFCLLTNSQNLSRKTDKVNVVQASDDFYFSKSLSSTAKNHENQVNDSNNQKCYFCNENHELCECDNFKSLTVTDRWQFVRNHKLCHKCLKKGLHSYKNCKNKTDICIHKKCRLSHHNLLHIAYAIVSEGEQVESSTRSQDLDIEPSTSDQTADFVAHASSSSTLDRPLLKIVAVTVSGPIGSVDTYALLDDGSTATFIDAELAAQVGARGPPVQTRLKCVGGLSKYAQMEYVDFKIKGRQGVKTHKVTQARSLKGLQLAKQTVCPRNIKDYPHLSDLISFLCYDHVQPKIVIGIDNWHLTLPQAVRKGSKHQPAACETALGWVLFGFTSSRTKPVVLVNNVQFDDIDNPSLENLIKEHYKLDAIGISKVEPRSKENERAINILENTASRLPCGRFEVGLLWKSDNPVVPNSYPLALSRFLTLEKKMISDPAYAERYKLNIHDLISKNYAEKCETESPSTSVCWYLPHFGVVNPNKPAKLRIVHDAAARIKGVSLNSLLLTGPDLLQSLFNILLRFREGKIAMTADIKEMFPRFKIIDRDRDAQRFLWRDSPNDPIGIYRMSSMIFGAVSSPFTAIYMKNKNALEVKDKFSQAANAIINDTYMDDYIGSVSSSDLAAHLAADIVHVHARAGLEMRGWVSNDLSALRLLPKHLLLDSMRDLNISLANFQTPIPCIRALGLYWHPSTDHIAFHTPVKDGAEVLPNPLTKRIILSFIMKVFDPLGILAPVVIRGRILFQNIWRLGLDWDTELPPAETKAWNDWYHDLILTSKLKIPRCYNLRSMEPSQVELHVFADASAQAYSAVAYWRFLYSNGDVQLALICSKSRVTPLKPSSIPRLELQAALISARLATSILDAVRIKPLRRTFWCDSMNVLGWLRNDARLYKPFIAHRVGEIIELTDVSEWRWVPSGLNVADDTTRLSRGPVTSDSRWIKGPDFLLTTDWPEEPVAIPPISKNTHSHFINEVISHHISLTADARRFSSWTRLIRASAYANRYLSLLRIHALRKKGIHVNFSHKVENLIFTFDTPPTPNVNRGCGILSATLTSEELRLATIHVLRTSQLDSFSDEIRCITNRLPVPRRSRLSKLPATLDNENVLRLSSRIVAVTNVQEEIKSPILLDGKHPAVRLLVLHYHRKAAHANTEMVVNELRQQYWILNLRSTVRSAAYNCQFCKVRRCRTLQPPMGNLPAARLAHHCRPFSFVGLDYFGPVTVKVGRRKEKRYVGLFTCLTTRAIHLEVVYSLSSDAAIMALKRFVSRRGTPTEIHSDNGTSFVGANRELKVLYREAVPNFAAGEMIKWKFIPPSAPFMGGSWERLVRSVKTALKVTLGSNLRTPTDEVFMTLLCEAEALVNSRPLTHVACDPQHPESLTPNHFLLGYSSGRPIPAELTDSDSCSRAGWRRALRLADHFWNRWVKEYLPTLAPRRSIGEAPSIAVGDVVVIADGTLPRGSWPKGRVTALYPGRDGVTRVVDVTTEGGVFRRPVKKVVPLL